MMREKAIVYGLGKCWDDNWEKIIKDFEIICCADKNIDKSKNTKGFEFCTPMQISSFEYDKLIICSYGIEIGIREEIILLWDIAIEKIYYYSELFLNNGVRIEGNYFKESIKLTIVIPTYNRKERLERTLDILEHQTYKNFKIIILDNASDYNIIEIIEERNKEFCCKIEIRRNISNIGMNGNLALSFLQVNDGWMWTLADDDIPSVYAVEIIMREIEKKEDAGVFWFSISDIGKYLSSSLLIKNLSDLAKFYRDIEYIEKYRYQGDFIYLSNKVYNAVYVKKYLEKVFTYSYTGIPHIIPILYMLSEKEAELVISCKKIVAYASPEGDHWDWLKTALGMSTITDISLAYTNDEDRKILYRLLMIDSKDLFEDSMKDVTYEKIEILEKLYDKIYKIYLEEEERKRYLQKISLLKQLL